MSVLLAQQTRPTDSHPGADYTWHLSALSTAETDALVDPTGTRARVFALVCWLAAGLAALLVGAGAALAL